MEENLQNRMYHFEMEPPLSVWATISNNIQMGNVVALKNGRNASHRFSTTMIAATVLLFIIVSIFFELRPDGEGAGNNVAIDEHYSLLGPAEENPIHTQSGTTYVNVLGPRGKVRISSKVASIIASPNKTSKPEWNKKIAHWKDLMLTASNTDFMDVIPITQTAEVEN
jgi:hypothetical protein